MNKSITLDLTNIQTQDDFHQRAFEAFSFPSYYGRNKDAFWDCITEFVGDTAVLVKGEKSLPFELQTFVSEYIAILVEYEKETDGAFRVRRSQLPEI